jgi:hypothetical protein
MWFAVRRVQRHPYLAGFSAVFLSAAGLLHSWLLAAVVITTILVVWGSVKIAWTVHQGFALVSYPHAVLMTLRIYNVKRRWPRAAAKAGFLARDDKEPPFLIGLHAEGHNVAGILDLGSSGFVVEDVVGAAGRLSSTMRTRFIRVLAEMGVPSECKIVFEWKDPLDRPYKIEHLIEKSSTEELPRNHIAVAITEVDEVLTLNTRLSALFVGESGSGKSTFLWSGLAAFQRQGIPVRVRVIDPAGGVELAALGEVGEWVWVIPAPKGSSPSSVVRYRGVDRKVWGPALPTGEPPAQLRNETSVLRVCKPCLYGENPGFHVHAYTDRAKGAEQLVKDAHQAMFTRLRGMDTRDHTPSFTAPHDLTIVDEMLLLRSMLSKGVDSPAGEILTIGRKASYTLWGCSQLPQKDVLGEMRDLFPQRFCFAVANREATDIVLGQGASTGGAKPHLISDSQPGVGYKFSQGNRRYIRFRGPHILDSESDQIAAGEILTTNWGI